MLGAIIGDLAGSIYEFEQIKNTHPVIVDNIIENDSFYSDDTILTIAILDAIISKEDYGQKLKEYVKNKHLYCVLEGYKTSYTSSRFNIKGKSFSFNNFTNISTPHLS